MKLTQEQMNKIIEKAADVSMFDVYGFNADGLNFNIQARLSYGAQREPRIQIFPRIQEDGIVFEFGKKQGALNRTYDFSAVFLTEYDSDKYFEGALIIDQIKLFNGEVIYKNPDSEKYGEIINKQNSEKNKEKEISGRNLNNLDSATLALLDMIGQPIIIDDVYAGVLVSVDSIANDGSVMIILADGSGLTNNFIQKNTKVSTIDLFGKIIPIAENGKSLEDKEKMDKIFDARLKHIAEMTNSQKEPQ